MGTVNNMGEGEPAPAPAANIRIFISGNSGSKEITNQQHRITMILKSLGIALKPVDISAPGMDEQRDFMRASAKKKEGQRHALPPQIFNGEKYCGDYDDFFVANEDVELEEFLGIPRKTPKKEPEAAKGDETTFKEDVLGKCETWYEWLIGKLLYTNPSVRTYDLPYHAEEAITNFGGLGSMTTLDSVLLAVMEMDMSQVMNELCNTLDNFWYPAHLLDLLHHSGSLESNLGQQNEQIQAGASLREFLLLEYATCLMTHNSLWQGGALYLDHCPVQGKQRLELLLERVPPTSERKAEKVLNIAAERGMASLTTSICKVMGMKCLHQNQLGNAMTWALRSQDSTFTSYLADKLLKLYCESGTFSSGDLLDHLGVSMVVSDRLTFLAKYREFHGLAGNGDYASAAALLHSLLWSRLAPKYFWVTLLTDTLPFLADSVNECLNEENGRKAFFTSEQTYELIHCLHELQENLEDLPAKQKNSLLENEAELRRKLAINLSVALMQENDASSVKNMSKQSKLSIPALKI